MTGRVHGGQHQPKPEAMAQGARELRYRSRCIGDRVRSASWSSVGVAGGDAAFAEFGQHGGVVDAQVFAYPCQGPAKVVEMDGVVYLLWSEAAAAHRYVVSFEDVADRSSVDVEPVAELVHRRSGLVPGDEFLDLVGVELTCPPWFGSLYRWWSRFGGVG